MLERPGVVTRLFKEPRQLELVRHVIRKVAAERDQFRGHKRRLAMGQQKLDQLEAHPPPRVALLDGPRRVERVVIEAQRLGDVITARWRSGRRYR
jgi:hypothetical protein